VKHALWGCTFAAYMSSACGVTTVEPVPSTIAQNTCQSDSDCAGGSCTDQQCRSRQGTFQTVLFQITPPADISLSAGVPFLQTKEDLSLSGGALSLSLDSVAQVTGQALAVGRTCVPGFDVNGAPILAGARDGSVPASVSLTPSVRTLGLFSSPVVADTTAINDMYFGFSLNVAPGNYDIYVQPRHQPDDSCVVPPQLRRAQPITGGALKLAIKLLEPSSFEFHVTWPRGDGGLNGWTVDMLDPVSGHVISNRSQLAVSTLGKTDYVATISYAPVQNDTDELKAQELVRLSPPDDETAPTVLMARSALGLFDANRGTLSQFSAKPTKVHVQGQVTALATPKPVAATVSLVATKITGIEPGVLASFVRTASAGKDGQFEVDLLPGTYRVSAIPTTELDPSSPNSELAATTQEWLVADSPSNQAGKVIELSQALPINGQAFDASFSTPVTTSLVQAVASSASIKTDVLHQALGEALSVPRAGTASVSLSGDFSLLADSGTFDVSVRPLAATGFGWLVVPGVEVGTTPESSAGANLGTRGLPLPVVYTGTVTEPGSMAMPDPVPGALIRAYVFTTLGAYTADASKADSLVQVAETRAGTEGEFTLLIPASLNGTVR
jgi:hypothetical protein